MDIMVMKKYSTTDVPAATNIVNSSFQDDEEQDEAAQYHHGSLPVRLLGGRDDDDDDDEGNQLHGDTPFDEELSMIHVLDEKKESENVDDCMDTKTTTTAAAAAATTNAQTPKSTMDFSMEDKDNADEEHKNQRAAMARMTTPDQQLKLPPLLVKKKNLEWNLSSDDLIASSTLDPQPHLHILASKASGNNSNEEEDAPIDEISATDILTVKRRPIISPDGQVEYSQGDEMAVDAMMDTMPLAGSERTSEEEEGKYLPRPAALRSISAPIQVMFNEEGEATNQQYLQNGHDSNVRATAGRQENGTLTTLLEDKPDMVLRSVSDIPKSTSVNDWTKYLLDGDQVKGITDISQWLDQDGLKSADNRRPSYRDMTPKQDFKLSEKSAAWLQEEFKRRSTIKKEINAAILARSDLRKEDDTILTVDRSYQIEDASVKVDQLPVDGVTGDEAFAVALSQALEALPKLAMPAHNFTSADMSLLSEDDEVAALTRYKSTPRSFDDGLKAIPSDEDASPAPRRLDYGAASLRTSFPVAISGMQTTAAQQNGQADFRQDMLRFANETRKVLHGQNRSSMQSEEPTSRFRSLAGSSSIAKVDELSIEATASLGATNLGPNYSALTDEASDHSRSFDIASRPMLVESMDSHLGIAKGDITLSLLNEDSSTSAKSTWANRVRAAVWRARRMRRGLSGNPNVHDIRATGTPARGRSSLPVDMDEVRVAGGVRTVQATQEAALGHLIHDEIDEALELFEDIIFAYYGYFEQSLQAREANPGGENVITDFRPYIGAALHNLGILNLLKGEYRQALSYFGRAVDNRRGCLGEAHSDHVVRVITLFYASYSASLQSGTLTIKWNFVGFACKTCDMPLRPERVCRGACEV
jgi:tetratricopeptide (TPR) repeat protein